MEDLDQTTGAILRARRDLRRNAPTTLNFWELGGTLALILLGTVLMFSYGPWQLALGIIVFVIGWVAPVAMTYVTRDGLRELDLEHRRDFAPYLYLDSHIKGSIADALTDIVSYDALDRESLERYRQELREQSREATETAEYRADTMMFPGNDLISRVIR